MFGTLRMRRSRGAASGFLLVLLGLWGGLIPFIGPYFHYAYHPRPTAWTYTTARLWLEILPGGGHLPRRRDPATSARRHSLLLGAALAAAISAWFTLGTVFSPLWNHNVPMGGQPASLTVVMSIAEQVGFFTGLGVVVAALATFAFGRIWSLPSDGGGGHRVRCRSRPSPLSRSADPRAIESADASREALDMPGVLSPSSRFLFVGSGHLRVHPGPVRPACPGRTGPCPAHRTGRPTPCPPGKTAASGSRNARVPRRPRGPGRPPDGPPRR